MTMHEMAVSLDEVSNIGSQLPPEVVKSGAMHYDPAAGVLRYSEEVRDLIEKADRTFRNLKRVPETVTLLQFHLEMIARGIDVAGCVASLYEPERSVLTAVLSFSASLRYNDERVKKILTYSGVTDTGDFFIMAAKRK